MNHGRGRSFLQAGRDDLQDMDSILLQKMEVKRVVSTQKGLVAFDD